MLFGAPILYMCMGMWLFSNQQVFRDKVKVNKTSFLFGDTDHHLTQFFTQITPGTVFFIFVFLSMIFYLCRFVLRKFKIVDSEL